MVNYSQAEKYNILECYLKSNKSVVLAEREYRARFPDRQFPSRKTVFKIVRNLSETGSLTKFTRNEPKTVMEEDSQLRVLLYFEENATKSIRDASRDLMLSRTSIWRTLKQMKYKPYKFLPVQEMLPLDHVSRFDFCSAMLDRHFDQNVFMTIGWTDEASFTTRGIYNRKNTHYWSSENQRRVKTIRRQGYLSVNVWCMIVGNQILGPVFFNGNLNGERYLEMLRNEILPLINQLPDNIRQNLIFQQDNAPCHNTAAVQQFLNEHFNTWIGSNGTISWPPRSPDLTPMDYFLWGTLKNAVYEERPENINDMKRKIRDQINRLNGNGAVERAVRKLEARYTMCILQDGRHIENFL